MTNHSNPLKTFPFGDFDYNYVETIQVDLSKSVQNNGTLLAHVLVANMKEDSKDVSKMLYTRAPLTRLMRRRKASGKKNLLSQEDAVDGTEAVVSELDSQQFISYWWPNMTLNLVSDGGNLTPQMHPAVQQSFLAVSRQQEVLPPSLEQWFLVDEGAYARSQQHDTLSEPDIEWGSDFDVEVPDAPEICTVAEDADRLLGVEYQRYWILLLRCYQDSSLLR